MKGRVGLVGYSRQFTHISGHSSAVGRVQDRESSPVKDRHSMPCNQLSRCQISTTSTKCILHIHERTDSLCAKYVLHIHERTSSQSLCAKYILHIHERTGSLNLCACR